MLRKFIVECPAEVSKLDIVILSAKFGLISAAQPIPWYDKLMTPHQAEVLNPAVLTEMKRLLARGKYQKLLLNVGQAYLPALTGYELLVPDNLTVTQASGFSGRRQTILRDWLRGKPGPLLPVAVQGRARIRGIEIVLTADKVMERACQALASGNGDSQAFQSWYVQVNGHQVSPKWLVHQLTGLAVGEFHSDEARRALAQLGIEVKRV